MLCSEVINVSLIDDCISEIKADLENKESVKEVGAPENPIKKYVDFIYGLDDAKKALLFENISMVFSMDDIFSRLTKQVEFFSIPKERSEDVVNQLVGVFKEQKYNLIKAGHKVLINYSQFRKEFQFDRIIQLSQSREINFGKYYNFKNVNSIDPKDGVFAQQLADIEIEKKKIVSYAVEYAATSMFIQELIAEGEFSSCENNIVDEEIFYEWEALHGNLYDQDNICSDSEHNRLARNCLRNLTQISVSVTNTSLPKAMVVGKGIQLSDSCRIGWRKDWVELYGGCE